MTRWLALVLALLLLALPGCGRRKDRGNDWPKDRPRVAPDRVDG